MGRTFILKYTFQNLGLVRALCMCLGTGFLVASRDRMLAGVVNGRCALDRSCSL